LQLHRRCQSLNQPRFNTDYTILTENTRIAIVDSYIWNFGRVLPSGLAGSIILSLSIAPILALPNFFDHMVDRQLLADCVEKVDPT
jgi:hypothetical protein